MLLQAKLLRNWKTNSFWRFLEEKAGLAVLRDHLRQLPLRLQWLVLRPPDRCGVRILCPADAGRFGVLPAVDSCRAAGPVPGDRLVRAEGTDLFAGDPRDDAARLCGARGSRSMGRRQPHASIHMTPQAGAA